MKDRRSPWVVCHSVMEGCARNAKANDLQEILQSIFVCECCLCCLREGNLLTHEVLEYIVECLALPGLVLAGLGRSHFLILVVYTIKLG